MGQDTKIEEYTTLVLQRERIHKEAQIIWMEYLRLFGELLEERYAFKIECIKCKKILAFYQARKNRGEKVFRSDVNLYIEKVMRGYYDKLAELIDARKEPACSISEIEWHKIKKLYRKLATTVHPDLHPSLFENEEIADLWERVKAAYVCNDYAELQRIEVLVFDALKRFGKIEQEISVENVDAKIAVIRTEIEQLIHNDPYTYKYLLQDEEATRDKKSELEADIEEFKDYLILLQEEVNKLDMEECS